MIYKQLPKHKASHQLADLNSPIEHEKTMQVLSQAHRFCAYCLGAKQCLKISVSGNQVVVDF